MIVLGGRPGMGKTGMALGIALAAAAGRPCRCSTPASKCLPSQLGKRALSILTGILSHYLMQTGKVEHNPTSTRCGLQGIAAARRPAASRSTTPADRRQTTSSATARRLKRQGLLDFLIVDHLQLMRPPRETQGAKPSPADYRIHHAHEGPRQGARHPRAPCSRN